MVLLEQNFSILCLAETHFLELEKPPDIKGYEWLGTNRQRIQNPFGGVEVLVHNSLTVQEIKENKVKDSIFLRLALDKENNDKLGLAVVYFIEHLVIVRRRMIASIQTLKIALIDIN